MKILLIDDDGTLRQLIRMIMQQEGWEVLEASDGRAGLIEARMHLPDLILCDFEMDGLNGYQTLAALRSNDATATIPFILMTGAAERAGMRQSMNLGADDYLVKPFDQADLLRAIEVRVNRVKLNRRKAEEKLATLRTSIVEALPHELKTPLNGILSYAEMLQTDLDSFSREEIRSIMKDVHQCAARLDRQVSRFLHCVELLSLAANTARPAAGVRESGGEVKAELQEMAWQVVRRSGREADLQLHLGAAVPAVTPAHLARLAEELLDNACKYSPPHTPICLKTERRAGRFVLKVGDTGRGLTQEQVRKAGVFLQFDRLHYEQQGTGFGLAIVRLLAELNGGTLELHSMPGKGTTATVSLPLQS